MVGTRVGTIDGASLGTLVGGALGLPLGANVGTRDGTRVGGYNIKLQPNTKNKPKANYTRTQFVVKQPLSYALRYIAICDKSNKL